MGFEPVAEKKSYQTASLPLPLSYEADIILSSVISVNKSYMFFFSVHLNKYLYSIYRQKHCHIILVDHYREGKARGHKFLQICLSKKKCY